MSRNSQIEIDGQWVVTRTINEILAIAGDVATSHALRGRYEPLAVRATRIFSSSTIFQHTSSRGQQIDIIETLQNIAYHDPEAGGVPEVAQWCLDQWLRLLTADTSDVRILANIGTNWLMKAQSILVRIHEQERSPTSSAEGSSTRSFSPPAIDGSNGQYDSEREARLGMPDYVEARGLLQPAVEYFDRAVRIATQSNRLTSDLLSSAAEASMSLGL
ncbi:Hypothetical protein D9617_2g059530 [Elsinoe fawcettii]|nr:Hypothetical protein D9617_2g059530 [Elsinoe fawcettii]